MCIKERDKESSLCVRKGGGGIKEQAVFGRDRGMGEQTMREEGVHCEQSVREGPLGIVHWGYMGSCGMLISSVRV